MQPQTTIELSQTKSEAEEEEEHVEGEEREEQQSLIGTREVNCDIALTSSSCKESSDNGEPPNQSSWPHVILYLLSTLAVVGIVAFVSPFSPLAIFDAKDQPAMDSSSSSLLVEATTSFEVQARKDVKKQQQISNYIKGTAIIRNIHITHHAGTSICGQMKRLGPTPAFACMGKGKYNATLDHPWPTEEALANSHLNKQDSNYTAEWVKFWRPYFHFKSDEYQKFGDLHKTNWEYENLVSMIVMRDPLERFLSGGKCGAFHAKLGDPTEDNQDMYWEYANSACADNYALRVLANESSQNCVHGEDTSIACLESAKNLLNRFTFILDNSCLADSMVALGDALNLTITKEGFESRLHHEHPPTRDRLGNDTLYEYVKRRFRRDIELYEWSKERSIVVCDVL